MSDTDSDPAPPKPRINLWVLVAFDVLLLLLALPSLTDDGTDVTPIVLLLVALGVGTAWVVFRQRRESSGRFFKE